MKYDWAIIGGGSAGAILASRLSEDSERSVILIEAGPDYEESDDLPYALKFGFAAMNPATDPHFWTWASKGSRSVPDVLLAGGRVTGGGSAINGQVFLRGLTDDFEDWAAFGNTEWSFDSVLPSMKRIETDQDYHDPFHGSEGPLPISRFKSETWAPGHHAFFRAAQELGFPACADLNAPNASGVGPTPYNRSNGLRVSTAVGYLGPARFRSNLTIRSGCRALVLQFTGQSARSVLVDDGTNNSSAIEADQFIISAGAIGTPQLLMLSGIGPAHHLEALGIRVVADLPGVGSCLQDHPQVLIKWDADSESLLSPARNPCPVRSRPVRLRYTSPGSAVSNDMSLTVATPRTGITEFDGGSSEEQRGIQMASQIYHADAQGSVRLRSSIPTEPPVINFQYLDGPIDRRRMREAVKVGLELAESREFRRFGMRRTSPTVADLASDARLDDWLFREVRTSWHASSSCRMGPPSDPGAVVDQFCKVVGFDNLRIADASVMPNCIRANTNATVMTIAEHVASFIRSDR